MPSNTTQLPPPDESEPSQSMTALSLWTQRLPFLLSSPWAVRRVLEWWDVWTQLLPSPPWEPSPANGNLWQPPGLSALSWNVFGPQRTNFCTPNSQEALLVLSWVLSLPCGVSFASLDPALLLLWRLARKLRLRLQMLRGSGFSETLTRVANFFHLGLFQSWTISLEIWQDAPARDVILRHALAHTEVDLSVLYLPTVTQGYRSMLSLPALRQSSQRLCDMENRMQAEMAPSSTFPPLGSTQASVWADLTRAVYTYYALPPESTGTLHDTAHLARIRKRDSNTP